MGCGSSCTKYLCNTETEESIDIKSYGVIPNNKFNSKQVTKDPIEFSRSMFNIHGLIGEGGFGKVLMVMLCNSKKWYAIKDVNKHELLKHKTGVAMINGEIDALKRLDHPFVVGLQCAFQDKYSLFFLMDLKTGGDLRYYLRKKILFEERDVAFITSCIASALTYIHSRNIIHRDIKPENIILDEHGYPHLADFGVAHVQTAENLIDTEYFVEPTLTCSLASGTKQYLAPEVFTKSHIHGAQSDFWSLGVVAFELLHGKRPFEKHAPTNFIIYLDKAYSNKRLKLKELKHKSLQNDNTHSPTPSGMTAPSRTSSFSSTCSTDYNSLSPGQYPSPNGFKSSKSIPGLFPPINSTTSVNTDGSSTVDTSKKGFCSSVCYTPPLNTFSSSLASPFKALNRGIAARHTEDSNDVSAAIGVAESAFPCITPPRPTTTNHGHCHGNTFSVDDLPPLSNGATGNNTNMSLDQESFLRALHDNDTIASTPLPPADHWLVDKGELSRNLVVQLPTSNLWLGTISPTCIDFLSGLFEVRPVTRLSSSHKNELMNHQWFRENKVNDWDLMSKKAYRPHFRPGKRFIQDMFIQSVERLRDYEQKTGNYNSKSGSSSGGDDCCSYIEHQDFSDELFPEFKYTSANFTKLMKSELV